MLKRYRVSRFQHDSGSVCTPGETSFGGFGTDGNYIMYARATSGTQNNNDKFSPCSIGNISLVLEAKKDKCFVRKYTDINRIISKVVVLVGELNCNPETGVLMPVGSN